MQKEISGPPVINGVDSLPLPPLTVILGMADQMQDSIQKGTYDEVDQTVKIIHRNGQNLLRLVNEMLDMAKLDHGVLELELIQGDVLPFIRYVTSSFQSIAEKSQVALNISSKIDALVMDYDAGKLTSIITNLISNAIKFTPRGGTVTVTIDKVMKKQIPCLYLAFTDTGTGIAVSDLPHIFDRFYQADGSLTRKTEGTGIGLAYTRELVNLMQGTIEVISEPGKGSEFQVILPVSNGAVKGEAAAVGELNVENPTAFNGLIQPGSHSNIDDLPLALVIEDNLDVTRYLKWCLEGK